ncbi:unnamed protein product, partial [Meganyctiphanes norvegica]
MEARFTAMDIRINEMTSALMTRQDLHHQEMVQKVEELDQKLAYFKEHVIDPILEIRTLNQDCNCRCLNNSIDCAARGCLPVNIDHTIATDHETTIASVVQPLTAIPSSQPPTNAIAGLDMWKAAKRGDLAFINKALASGTDIHWENPDHLDRTALHVAAEYNHPAVVRRLIAAGGYKDQLDNINFTPLFSAAQGGSTDAVRILIDEGADVNIPKYGNYTAIHDAAHNNHIDIVQLLLMNDATPHSIEMALEVARGRENDEVAKIIANFIGSTSS